MFSFLSSESWYQMLGFDVAVFVVVIFHSPLLVLDTSAFNSFSFRGFFLFLSLPLLFSHLLYVNVYNIGNMITIWRTRYCVVAAEVNSTYRTLSSLFLELSAKNFCNCTLLSIEIILLCIEPTITRWLLLLSVVIAKVNSKNFSNLIGSIREHWKI